LVRKYIFDEPILVSFKLLCKKRILNTFPDSRVEKEYLCPKINDTLKMNNLFPIFVKIENLHTLLVGGGNVGLEKLSALLANAPNARVSVVADRFLDETLTLASEHPHVQVYERKFDETDLIAKDLVILATDNPQLHAHIKTLAAQQHLLCNVADTPHLCDFYLGSIVQKGDLKIAISTNGKSPTLAKRLKEFLNDLIPNDIQDVLDNLQKYRDTLKDDFQGKIKKLNQLTEQVLKSGE
jgi:precorrin-2 dehydrogenase / sirohydrochlorin ferrochelatase